MDDYGISGYGSASYGESFADVYDEWYENLNDLDFVEYVAHSLPAHPVRVLELGVGTGRLIAHLLRLRHHYEDTIVGVDASPLMLQHASRRSFPSRVHLEESDFSHSLPEGPFDCVFIGYNTIFNLPNTTAVGKCLRLITSVMSPAGRLYIDAVAPNGQGHGDHIGCKVLANGEKVLSLSSHDPTGQRITGQFIQFDTTGHPRFRPWSVHYETPSQLDDIAVQAGLHLIARYGDSVGEPFTHESSRHISTYAFSS